MIKNKLKPNIVYIRKDKKKGRGLSKKYNLIKKIVFFFRIKLVQVDKLDKKHFFKIFLKLNPDLFIISGYGNIIPEYYFSLVTYGFFNFHPSLLPRWIGAMPINRSFLAGEKLTGLSVIALSKLIDKGPIYFQFPHIIKLENCDMLEKDLAYINSLACRIFFETKTYLYSRYIKQNEKNNYLYAYKINKKEKL